MSENPYSSVTSHFTKGTGRQFRKIMGISPKKIPFMKFKEIAIMEDLLHNKQPARVLEYGCGFSTLYFPKFLPKNGQWVSVEHEEGWFGHMQRELKQAEVQEKVALHFVAPDLPSWELEGDYNSFKTYVDFPHSLPAFDIVLVDGMAREECIIRAEKLLKPDGLLIVHDANRRKYHPLVKAFPHYLIFEDFRKTAGGFGFGSMVPQIDKLLDIPYHRKVWQMDTKVNNFFKFKYLLGKKSKPFAEFSNV